MDCDDYKTLLTDNRTNDRYIKCDHCGYHNTLVGDLVNAVDTLKNHNHKGTYLPKPKNIVQKIGGLFHCCYAKL
jgi:hypothetical protein